MEYSQELSEDELKRLKVFSDFELNSEDGHLGQTLENELWVMGYGFIAGLQGIFACPASHHIEW